MKIKYLSVLIVTVLILSVIPITSTANNGKEIANPGSIAGYYVFSTNAKMKADLGALHEFPNAFSTKLTSEQAVRLKNAGIHIEPVSVFEIVKPSAGRKPSPTTRYLPTDQTPWGIEKVYNNPSITSTSDGTGVDVAVLDTGVFKDHLDLKQRVAQCKDFTGGTAKDSCNDGNGHGTHVAGTILADAGFDKKGIYGVAPEARLFAYKVCNNGGLCLGDSVAAAIRAAADNGAEIISMSFGGYSLSTVEKEAIDYAVGKGLLLVAAAGNSGPGYDTISYPAAYVKVVAVAAIDSTDTVTDFSSRGKNNFDFIIEEREVEVAAPGKSVESTWKDSGYRFLSGTSMATPHVSGLAAKFWNGVTDLNDDGSINGADVRIFILGRAKDYDITKGILADAGDDPASGFGLPTVPP